MATANDLTRQQLDELDALLQRMLTVPVTKVEPSQVASAKLPEPPSGWRVDPPAPPSAPHRMPSVALAEPVRMKAAVELPNPGPAPLPFTPSPLLPVVSLERAKAPAFEPPPHEEAPELPVDFARLDLAELTPLPEPEVMSEPVEVTSSLSPMLWPLAIANWLIENTLKLFGPPGEMLTGRAGKNLLGTAGVLMIIGAGLWAVQSQGWVKLPMDKILTR